LSNINTITPNTGRTIQEDGDVVNQADFAELITKTLVVAGTVSVGGSPYLIADNTKNFEASLFTGKLIKVTIDDIEYIRKVVSCEGRSIQITPILEAVAASIVIGSIDGPQLTITSEESGEDGNSYSVIVVNGAGPNVLMSATVGPETNILTVTLATDGEGLPDNTTNTGMNVASAIDALPEFTAEMTGAGGVVTEIAEAISFTGGIDAILIDEGTPYEILLTDPNQIDVKVDGMGSVDTTPVIDPDALSANELGLLRGILKYLKDGKFTPIGTDGNSLFTDSKPGSMKLTGSILAEQKTNDDADANHILTFSAPITAIEIIHEESTWQTFIVNGITFKVPQGVYSRSIDGTPSVEVTIPAGIVCVVGRLV